MDVNDEPAGQSGREIWVGRTFLSVRSRLLPTAWQRQKCLCRPKAAVGQPTEGQERPHRRQQRMMGWDDEEGSRSSGGGVIQPHDQGVGGSGGGGMNQPHDQGVGGTGGGGASRPGGGGGGVSDGGGVGAAGGSAAEVNSVVGGFGAARIAWPHGFTTPPTVQPNITACVVRPVWQCGRHWVVTLPTRLPTFLRVRDDPRIARSPHPSRELPLLMPRLTYIANPQSVHLDRLAEGVGCPAGSMSGLRRPCAIVRLWSGRESKSSTSRSRLAVRSVDFAIPLGLALRPDTSGTWRMRFCRPTGPPAWARRRPACRSIVLHRDDVRQRSSGGSRARDRSIAGCLHRVLSGADTTT